MNLNSRLNKHLNQLEEWIHPNFELQKAWQDNGLDFAIIEEVPKTTTGKELLKREQYWILAYGTLKSEYGFNQISSQSLLFTKEEIAQIPKYYGANQVKDEIPPTTTEESGWWDKYRR